MRFDYGYAEEDHLGKPYDIGLIKRLWPFLRPYRRLLVLSVGLVVIITLFELAMPYFSKIAIDRYIVPRQVTSDSVDSSSNEDGRQRFLRVDQSSPAVREVVRRHQDLFDLEGPYARIAFDDIDRLPVSDLKILRQKDLAGLTLIVLVFLGVVILNFGLTFLQRMIMEYAGHKVMHDLRVGLFDHIQQQRMAFFDRQPIARLVTRATNDVQNMHELFTTFITMVFKDIFLLAGIAVVLVYLDWRLAIAGFAVLPLVVWVALVFSSRARDVFRALRVKVAEINARMAETIDGILTIQAFGREGDNYAHFEALNEANYQLGMRQIHIFAVFMPVIEVLGLLSIAIVILYGGGAVLGGAVSLGAFVAAISYLRMFFRPLRDLSENYNVLQNAMASAERIFALFDKRSDTAAQRPAQVAMDQNPGPLETIELERVSFGYAVGETVLHDVSFSVEKGRTVALVGPTGSGKSTLLSLILRFYEPDAGAIRYNGLDARQWENRDLRRRMALVPQDPLLFSGTLRENIVGDAADMPPETLDRIVEAANCRSLVDRLAQGIDTPLVKGGASLSSGERQLVTIARAFARDPELILLDEATSYIDSRTEAVVHQALRNLMKGRTAIIVAHRLSTARMADIIFVLRGGRMVEAGDHESLMARNGVYRRLTRQGSL